MRGWPRVGCCYLANIVRQPIHPWTTTNAEFSLVSSDISTDSGNTVFEQICFFPRTMWNFRIQFLVMVNRFEMFFWLDKSVWLYRMYKMCWKFLCVLPTFVTISRLARISAKWFFCAACRVSHKSLLNICHQMDGHAIEPCIKFNHWNFLKKMAAKEYPIRKCETFPHSSEQISTIFGPIWLLFECQYPAKSFPDKLNQNTLHRNCCPNLYFTKNLNVP